jgi:hypothetical protein
VSRHPLAIVAVAEFAGWNRSDLKGMCIAAIGYALSILQASLELLSIECLAIKAQTLYPPYQLP